MDKYDFKEEVLQVIKNSGVISGKELMKAFGHKDTRQTRMAIQQLRKEGHPICLAYGDKGYFYSTNEDDIERTVRNLLQRAEEIIAVCEGMAKGVE